MNLGELQTQMNNLYGPKDRERGLAATVAWLAEEVGELAQVVRKGTRQQQEHEIGDVLAWLASLANQLGVSLEASVERWTSGCPHCAATPCQCP